MSAASALGARHAYEHQPPGRRDLHAWQTWISETFTIDIMEVALPALIVGVAVLLQTEHLKGVILLQALQAFPLWTLCHELGHIVTGAAYSIDVAQDGQWWRAVPAERAASEYAACLLMPEREVMDALADGQSISQIARHWCVPEAVAVFRVHLMGLRV